jgi:hypothetical protein
MAKSRIPPTLRAAVLERAQARCEYCQVPEECELTAYEVDHIVAEQHGGATELENLAYSCFECNRYKGPNLTSIDPESSEVVLLFNPRAQQWDDHFILHDDGAIFPRSAVGRATARLLHFDDALRRRQRADLIAAGKMAISVAPMRTA